jgi:flavin reductase (DIM6/NTAB) family NADH-FMN oxidoreductase RutF
MQLTSRRAYRILHPRPVAIVVSISRNGNVNGCAASWFTPVNADPPMIAVALSPRRLTYEYIQETGELTLCIPTADMADAVHYVGSVSGRKEPNKLAKAGFKLRKSKVVKPPTIEGCAAIAECIITHQVKLPDHVVVICKAVHVEADERLFEDMFKEGTAILQHVGGNIYTIPSKYFKVE